jgi:hypothetical protein
LLEEAGRRREIAAGAAQRSTVSLVKESIKAVEVQLLGKVHLIE